MDTFLATIFVIICVLLVIVILLQKGRGGGLGGAFGGTSHSAFGTRTGDVFTWVTIVLVGVFLLLAIGTTLWFRPGTTAVAPPVLQPPPRADGETRAVTLTMSSRTSKANLWYTVDGSEPTPDGKTSYKYDGTPVRVEPGTVVKAKGLYGGWTPSETVTAGYFYPAPSFEPPPGPIKNPIEVTIAHPSPGAEIYYSYDPSSKADWPKYQSPLKVSGGMMLAAYAKVPRNPAKPEAGVGMSLTGTASYPVATGTAPASGPGFTGTAGTPLRTQSPAIPGITTTAPATRPAKP